VPYTYTMGLRYHGGTQYGVIVSMFDSSRFLKVVATFCIGDLDLLVLLLALVVDLKTG
jgi:hypothetical protein